MSRAHAKSLDSFAPKKLWFHKLKFCIFSMKNKAEEKNHDDVGRCREIFFIQSVTKSRVKKKRTMCSGYFL